MIEIQQPVVQDENFEEIEEVINEIFYEILFRPLIEVLARYKRDFITNSMTTGVVAIIEAMKKGTISMNRNKVSVTFTGKFNSTLSKEFKKLGGTYNTKEKSWNVPYSKLPQEINAAQGQIKVSENQMKRDMQQALPSLDQVKDLVKENNRWLKDNMHKAVEDMESDWKSASRNLSVQPNFTDQQRENIAKAYTENMEKYVVSFTENQVKDLRVFMEDSIATGNRASSVVKELQERYGISQRKAKFLAKQETRLLSTQYLHERAKVSGCKRFRWSSSHDSRVRADHKRLDGQVFTFDNLPVIYSGKKGDERGLAGQAYGCRCRAIYLFD